MLIHLVGFMGTNAAITVSVAFVTFDILAGIHFGSRVAEWLL